MVPTLRSRRLNSFSLHATLLALAALPAVFAAASSSAQSTVPRLQTDSANITQPISSKDIEDLGKGSRLDNLPTVPGVLTGVVYDPKGTPRVEETDSYTIADGQKKPTERHIFNFGPTGKPILEADYKFDLKGTLKSYDISHFGLHGEKTWQQEVKYNLDGFQTKTLNGFNHKWIEELTPFKPLTPSQPGKPPVFPPSNSVAPIDTKVGVLIPRNLHPGQTFTGSIWPASYAENFSSVPGLSEVTFTVPLVHLPDGSPNWAGLEIGVQNNGFLPVSANGQFSVDLPINLDVPIRLQARPSFFLNDPVTKTVNFDIGKPVAAPKLPENLIPNLSRNFLQKSALSELEHLWNVACDIKEELSNEDEKSGADFDPERIEELEKDLNGVWEDIDEILEILPPKLVDELIHDIIKENQEHLDWLLTLAPSEDRDEEINDLENWDEFLNDQLPFDVFEQLRFKQPELEAVQPAQPFWCNPVQPAGKLIGIHGPFSDDPFNSFVHIGAKPLWPIASTPTDFYAMPPIGLIPGPNNYTIDTPGISETSLPFFFMTMVLSAASLSLKKGQSTTYHVTLNGLNGIDNKAWNSGFVPIDLVSPPASQPGGSGSSSAGSITLEITNMSPGTIAMQNQFFTLNAQSFAPAGLFHTDGGLTAVADGGFTLQAVATAFLQPQIGLGTPSGANLSPVTDTTVDSNPDFNWNPKIDWNLKAPITNFSTDPDCNGGPATCIDPAIQRAIDRVFNPATANLQPTATSVPTQPTDAAVRHIRDTNIRARQLGVDFSQKLGIETQAWNQALKDLPASTASAFNSAADQFKQADIKFKFDWNHFGGKPLTPQALRGAQQSSQNFSDTSQAFDSAVQDAINHFTPADRAAWESARREADMAFWAHADALDSQRLSLRF